MSPLIAIVDDEPSVRVALGRLCSAYGLESRSYASVQQLFAALDTERPDCLVLDAHMPGLGGLDAQAWLREHGINIPAVMITGQDDEEIESRSHSLGATAFLCKPVDAEVLLGAINDAIGKRERAD
jgi:FixJ family two-component response regulator